MENRKVLGIDVGGTKILIGLLDEKNTIIEQRRYPTVSTNQKTVITSVFDAIEHYRETVASVHDPVAAGIGLVGHVNTQTGVWENSISLKINDPVPICETLEKKYKIPFFADNDVHAATLAEIRFGAGKQVKDFIYMSIGTGIAAGIVCNGQLVRGASNYAGEVGHMTVSNISGPVCKCNRQGCIEPVVSGGGIVRSAVSLLEQYPDSALKGFYDSNTLHAGVVYDEAEKGDKLSLLIVDNVINALEETLTNLVNLLNPAMIVFGGGALSQKLILGQIKDNIYKNALPVAVRALNEICISGLDANTLGLLGACTLALKEGT